MTGTPLFVLYLLPLNGLQRRNSAISDGLRFSHSFCGGFFDETAISNRVRVTRVWILRLLPGGRWSETGGRSCRAVVHRHVGRAVEDRKSTRLNSSHPSISYA